MKEENGIYCIFSAIGMFIWLLLSPMFLSSNSVIYFGGLFIFLATYLGQYYLINDSFYTGISSLVPRKMRNVIFFLFLIWAVCSYIYEYEYDSFQVKNYARHQVPAYVYFVLLIIISYFAIQLAYSDNLAKNWSKLIRVSLSFLVMYLQGIFLYNPNIFGGSEENMNLLHIDAYTTSIINASKGVPYTDTMNSIYGRYGIFYVIPVKLVNFFVHNKWIAVTVCVALVGALTYGIICYLLNVLIRNDFIFFLAVLASCVPGFVMIGHHSYEVYYQGFPHRILAQMIPLLCCFFLVKYEEKKWIRAICWVAMSLNLLWNLEIGIIGLIVWIICDSYQACKHVGWKGITLFKELIFVFLAFFGAYIVLWNYNFFIGDVATPVRVFLFPFIRNSSIEGIDGNSVFQNISESLYTRQYNGAFEGGFIFLIIFMAVISVGVIRLIKRELTEKEILIFVSSILGIESYFYHVSHDNFFTNHIFIVIGILVIAAIADYFSRIHSTKQMESNLNSILFYVAIIILVGLSIDSMSSLPTKYSRVEASIWKTEEAEKFAEEMLYSISEDTLCIGEGMPQVCAYAGFDPKIETSDMPDASNEVLLYLKEMIENNKCKYILVSKINEKYIPSCYEFVKEYVYMYNTAYTYSYYELSDVALGE
ncbi:MAG: hypothetical protein MJZ11_06910 [Lachnospiraceae bacterium]|nr:hypothetical protein [Lachnospiraceae bacterium]